MKVRTFGLHDEAPAVQFQGAEPDLSIHEMDLDWCAIGVDDDEMDPLLALYIDGSFVQRWRHYTSGLAVWWLRQAANRGCYYVSNYSDPDERWHRYPVTESQAESMRDAADALEKTINAGAMEDSPA